ncbi:hypothetical protein [Sphingobacterium multivorum]|uniref:hypothetical protein n=1 Tax=Sphingobacterium multivorum TaxID=28454 RepID=UPI0028A173A3|nr:hypothetical protein [Sphingobacterium multivorum]
MALFQLNNQSAPADESSYSLASGTPSCVGDRRICTITANDNGAGQPEIDENLLSEMVTALNTHSNTTNVKLKA